MQGLFVLLAAIATGSILLLYSATVLWGLFGRRWGWVERARATYPPDFLIYNDWGRDRLVATLQFFGVMLLASGLGSILPSEWDLPQLLLKALTVVSIVLIVVAIVRPYALLPRWVRDRTVSLQPSRNIRRR